MSLLANLRPMCSKLQRRQRQAEQTLVLEAEPSRVQARARERLIQ